MTDLTKIGPAIEMLAQDIHRLDEIAWATHWNNLTNAAVAGLELTIIVLLTLSFRVLARESGELTEDMDTVALRMGWRRA